MFEFETSSLSFFSDKGQEIEKPLNKTKDLHA